MFLSMPTHKKANKEKANVLKDIISRKFNTKGKENKEGS